MKNSSDVGARIRFFRRRAGKTQTELAQELGIHSSAVAHWERDAAMPTHENVAKVAAACGVTLPEFWADWSELALESVG